MCGDSHAPLKKRVASSSTTFNVYILTIVLGVKPFFVNNNLL